jgi:hypothetical protein
MFSSQNLASISLRYQGNQSMPFHDVSIDTPAPGLQTADSAESVFPED